MNGLSDRRADFDGRPAGRPSYPGPLDSGRVIEIKRFLVLMLVGSAMIIAGFILEGNLGALGNIWDHIRTPVTARPTPNDQDLDANSTGMGGVPLGVRPAGVGGVVSKNDIEHQMGLGAVLVLFLKEFGVAFIVAGLVGIVIEKQAREHDLRRTESLQRSIASNAIFALFGLAHDKDFVQSVVETNLKAEIVRRDMTMTYALRQLTLSEAKLVNSLDPDDALKRFVILDMEQRYAFDNVSSAPFVLKIPIAVARRRGAGARAVTGATYVSIDDVELNEEQIRNHVDLDRTTDELLSYTFERRLEPHGADNSVVRIVSNVRCLKELSDNEVWGSYFPTMGDVELCMRVLPEMNCGMRDLSNGELKMRPGVPKPNEKNMVLEGPLLRHSSVVFWWRTHADEAEAGAEPPNEYSPEPSVNDLPPSESEARTIRNFFRDLWAKFGPKPDPDPELEDENVA